MSDKIIHLDDLVVKRIFYVTNICQIWPKIYAITVDALTVGHPVENHVVNTFISSFSLPPSFLSPPPLSVS